MAPAATAVRNGRLRGPYAVTEGRRGVPATVTIRRSALDDLADELHVEQAEGIELAERVRVGADRIVAAATAGSRMAVVNEAGKIGYHASRFLRQRGAQ